MNKLKAEGTARFEAYSKDNKVTILTEYKYDDGEYIEYETVVSKKDALKFAFSLFLSAFSR